MSPLYHPRSATADQRERGIVYVPSRRQRSSQITTRDAILVTLQDLVLQRQSPRVHAELAVNIGITPTLEAHVSFLRVFSQGGHVAQRNHFIGMLIHEAHAGRNRPSCIPVDHAADDRLAGCPCLRAGRLGNLCGGDSPKETAPGVIQMQMAWVVCHGHKHIPERRFRAIADCKTGQKCPVFRYCSVEN